MDDKVLYNAVRGVWRASKERVRTTENRLFFEDKRYERGLPLDENEEFYLGKSIAGLRMNQSAQNPITYLNPR